MTDFMFGDFIARMEVVTGCVTARDFECLDSGVVLSWSSIPGVQVEYVFGGEFVHVVPAGGTTENFVDDFGHARIIGHVADCLGMSWGCSGFSDEE
jgi:hypothetical protein